MGNDICFLITILDTQTSTTLMCAMKVDRDALLDGVEEYPMEPENREQLHSLLPEHVRSCGPVIKVETIFEIDCALEHNARRGRSERLSGNEAGKRRQSQRGATDGIDPDWHYQDLRVALEKEG